MRRDVLLGIAEWHDAVRDLAAAEDQTSLDLDFGDG
jgi:hypothetical protein